MIAVIARQHGVTKLWGGGEGVLVLKIGHNNKKIVSETICLILSFEPKHLSIYFILEV